jgi:hypothetical protein
LKEVAVDMESISGRKAGVTARLVCIASLLLGSNAFAQSNVAPPQNPVAPPEVDWQGPQPDFVRRAYFALSPSGDAVDTPPSDEPQHWKHLWNDGELWLVVKVQSPPENHLLCAVWRDPGEGTARFECQKLDETGVAFASPDTRGWPAGKYVADLYLLRRSSEETLDNIERAPHVAAVAYGGGGFETAAVDPGPPPILPSIIEIKIPSFPWPPPTPTTRTTLSRTLFGNDKKLGDVGDRLERALGLAEYPDWGYYAVPNGFALATLVEHIRQDGTPMEGDARWTGKSPDDEGFSIANYLRALFTAPEGQYRVIVFVVTDVPFATAATAVTDAQAKLWVSSGANKLPDAIASIPFTSGARCVALIYQFRKNPNEDEPIFNPSGTPAKKQLERSGIIAAFTE